MSSKRNGTWDALLEKLCLGHGPPKEIGSPKKPDWPSDKLGKIIPILEKRLKLPTLKSDIVDFLQFPGLLLRTKLMQFYWMWCYIRDEFPQQRKGKFRVDVELINSRCRSPNTRYQLVIRCAAKFNCPMALIALFDAHEQYWSTIESRLYKLWYVTRGKERTDK